MLKVKNIIFPKLEYKQTDAPCCICGDMAGEYNLYDIVSSNFTNQNCIKLASNMVCEGCKQLFKYEKLRRSSFIATQKEIIFFKNNEGIQYLLNLPKEPYVISITKNWKKHTFLFCKVNYTFDECFIGTDFAERLFFKKSDWFDTVKLLQQLYQLGFSKEDLLTLEPSLNRFSGIGYDIKQWMEQKNILIKYNNNPMYEIIIMLINREDELVKEIYKKNKENKEIKKNDRKKLNTIDKSVIGNLFELPKRS